VPGRRITERAYQAGKQDLNINEAAAEVFLGKKNILRMENTSGFSEI